MIRLSRRLAAGAAGASQAQPDSAQLRRAFLDAAAEAVPVCGFLGGGAADAAMQVVRAQFPHADLSRALEGSAFPRGVEIAIVEHLVGASNAAARTHMLVISSKKEQAARALAGRPPNGPPGGPLLDIGALDTDRSVAFEGIKAKLGVLAPCAHHWPQAVHLELSPQNAPFAVKHLAEHADDVAYCAERQRKLRALLAAGASALRGLEASTPAIGASFVRAVLDSAPLSSGPHEGLQWYALRAAVAAVYATAMTHMIGESAALPSAPVPVTLADFPETIALLQRQLELLM